ncbi:alcohol dehydrogenase [Nitrosopumilus sp.]|uniref:alcohol dehydrogenase n=1 Tax=Nitrosopumilus sp. TaxID=2024843 RepID=UPI003B58B706
MKASQVIKPKEDLEITEIEVPKPKGRQVIVKVDSSGVCHSDIHVWQGGYEGKDGKIMKVEDRGVNFPLTMGHEIAGTVESVGEDVSKFKENQHVLVYPWIGDGTCSACQVGDEHVCDDPQSLGIYQDGGYAEKVLVPDEKYLVDIEGMDSDKVCSLACSGLTAYNAVKNSKVSPKQSLAIVGIGGLGLTAIQIAKALFNPTIIAIDLNDDRLKKASEVGADYTISSKSDNFMDKVKELTHNKLGPDAIIDFVNGPKTVEADLEILKKRGRLVLVGLFGGSAEINLPLLPMKSHTIIGSYTGRLADLADLVDLVKRNKVDPVVSKTFKLEDATKALNELNDGNIVGRAVLKP